MLSLSGIGCSDQKAENPKVQSIPAPATASNQEVKGAIEFKVLFQGTPPKMSVIHMNADRKCMAMHPKPVYFQTIEVNEHGMLRDAFIYVKKGLEGREFSPPEAPVLLNQHRCMYEPHVLGIMVDQPLEILNSDPVLHNIHSLPKLNNQFNVAQPMQGMKMEKKFSRVEVMVPVKCEVHSWMRCYVGVVNNPFYAVSDTNGTCEIKGLPPGNYLFSAWHEKLGSLDQAVTVSPGETKVVEFRFAQPS
jgi:hypothetical protein